MRITNLQIADLKKIVTDKGLQENLFEFSRQDEVFKVKFKQDFFFLN